MYDKQVDYNKNQSFHDYLYAFKSKLKWELNDFINHREKLLHEEPHDFHEEVERQFSEEIKKQLGEELANNFDTNPEEIAIFLENFDVNKWISGS